MVVFKRKQIVVLSLVLMIVIAGYLQYSYNRSASSDAVAKGSDKIGEAVYVDNVDKETISSKDQKDKKNQEDQQKKDTGKNSASTGNAKAESASKEANDYFTATRMDREATRGKAIETLKSIADDQNSTKESKNEANQKIMQYVQNNEKEMRIESLIKKNGFSDVVVLFGDDGSVDIVVKSPTLTSSQSAQITDIVSRQAKMDIDVEKIHIKNFF